MIFAFVRKQVFLVWTLVLLEDDFVVSNCTLLTILPDVLRRHFVGLAVGVDGGDEPGLHDLALRGRLEIVLFYNEFLVEAALFHVLRGQGSVAKLGHHRLPFAAVHDLLRALLRQLHHVRETLVVEHLLHNHVTQIAVSVGVGALERLQDEHLLRIQTLILCDGALHGDLLLEHLPLELLDFAAEDLGELRYQGRLVEGIPFDIDDTIVLCLQR